MLTRISFLLAVALFTNAIYAQNNSEKRLNSLADWVTADGSPITKGWAFENGVLLLKEPKSGDIFTKEHFDDFVFEFEFKISKECNSGIKYKLARTAGKGWLGLEYQIQDDENVTDGKTPKLSTAGVFDVLAASSESKSLKKPLGEWNKGKIVVQGNSVEHWLSDKKVLEFTIGSDDWNAKKALSKFKNSKEYGTVRKGPIMLQDHGHPVELRNMTVTQKK